jgi:hypothetical protein
MTGSLFLNVYFRAILRTWVVSRRIYVFGKGTGNLDFRECKKSLGSLNLQVLLYGLNIANRGSF